ncbi:MAG: hypothetical protein ACQEQR_02035 [Pseudomonadota bacterium]
MSRTVFSSGLFEQIGGVSWSTRPGSILFYPHNSDLVESLSENGNGLGGGCAVEDSSAELSLGTEVTSVQNMDNAKSIEESSGLEVDNSERLLTTPGVSITQADAEQRTVIEKPSVDASLFSENNQSNIVVVGAGLDAVWQNDETHGWQLWQNIMLAFDWDESQMTFFDTSHLVSDEVIFTTMEEIIELGVDWVLTMDDEHPISEQLVEGVHVVSVPDLESMLSDPYAKQNFYHSVVELSNPR